LLAIPGIDGAELEGDAVAPQGVRVQLSVGADPQEVGRQVQQVLAAHGMRSQMADEAEVGQGVASGSVVNLADYEAEQARHAAHPDPLPQLEIAGSLPPASAPVPPLSGPAPGNVAQESPAPSAAAADGDQAAEEAGPVVAGAGLAAESADTAGVAAGAGEHRSSVSTLAAESGDTAGVAAGAGEHRSSVSTLAAVSVREDRSGVVVTVTSDSGASASRTAPATSRGLEQAAVGAVIRLVDPAGETRLVAVADTVEAGSTIVVVLVEDERGVRAAGASAMRGDRTAAIARAAMAALSEADPRSR
jgi:hypothetical protein